MAIEGNQTSIKNILYEGHNTLAGVSSKTLLAWFYLNADISDTADRQICILAPNAYIAGGASPYSDESLSVYIKGKLGTPWINSIGVILGATLVGYNYETSSVTPLLTSGTLYHIALITSGISSPTLYVNNSSVSMGGAIGGSGTWVSGTNTGIYVFSKTSTNNPPIKLLSLCWYNRAFSAQEVSDAYNSKKAIPDYRGLMFSPQLWSRGENGEGGTIADNTGILDIVSGLSGRSTGAITYRQDQYLSY